MAGDWIPIRTDLDEDPAVVGVAVALSVPETQVIGWLWKLWSVASRQTVNGWLPHYTPQRVDELVSHSGFAAALEAVGWLCPRPGGLEIPNFDHWLSKSGKRRLKESKRQRNSYASHAMKSAESVLSSPVLSSSEQNSQNGARDPPAEEVGEYPKSAVGCARAWCFVLKRKKHGYPADRPDDMASEFGEMIRRGHDAAALLAEIMADRDKAEHFWQFKERLERNHHGAGRVLGQTSRIRAEPGKYDGYGTTVGKSKTAAPGAEKRNGAAGGVAARQPKPGDD